MLLSVSTAKARDPCEQLTPAVCCAVLCCVVLCGVAPQNSMTPLHYAAWQGSIDCVQLLLEHKADINKADAVSWVGM